MNTCVPVPGTRYQGQVPVQRPLFGIITHRFFLLRYTSIYAVLHIRSNFSLALQ